MSSHFQKQKRNDETFLRKLALNLMMIPYSHCGPLWLVGNGETIFLPSYIYMLVFGWMKPADMWKVFQDPSWTWTGQSLDKEMNQPQLIQSQSILPTFDMQIWKLAHLSVQVSASHFTNQLDLCVSFTDSCVLAFLTSLKLPAACLQQSLNSDFFFFLLIRITSSKLIR